MSEDIEYRCIECDETKWGPASHNPICPSCGEVMEATE